MESRTDIPPHLYITAIHISIDPNSQIEVQRLTAASAGIKSINGWGLQWFRALLGCVLTKQCY